MRAGPALILAAIALLTRAQIFGDPIAGSDEGFYLLVGDRMVHGALPYIDIWDRKPVGLFVLYAAIRLFGGESVLAYQLVGTGVAFATALLVRRLALEFSKDFAATAAAAAYLIWLPLGGAAGGQAELFCNLPMCAAALLTLRNLQAPRSARLTRDGAGAMLLVGAAMQIKYTALFAGIFLGCVWLFVGWKAGKRRKLPLYAILWVISALAPTLLAAAYYALRGQLPAFVGANFVSIWARGPAAPGILLQRLGLIAIILAPLLACARPPSAPRSNRVMTAYRFTLAWLGAAIAGLLLFGTYFQQYMLPVVTPASAAAAPLFDRIARWRVLGLLGVAFVLAQADLWIEREAHGSRREVRQVLAAVEPGKCLFVYSGLSALYRLSHACIPTRYAFPSHLSRAREADSIGVDPVQEVDRVMRSNPDAVVVRSPYDEDENWAARATLFRHLRQHYRLSFRGKLGLHPIAVYRLAIR